MDRAGEMDMGVGSRGSSLPGRVVGTFFAPGSVFRQLRDEPKIVGALVLGAIGVGLANAAIPEELWDLIVRSQLMAAGQELPEDLANTVRLARWGAAIGSTLVWPILSLLMAAVYSLVFVLGLGYDGTYRQYWSITAHAMLITAVGALLLTPLRIWTQDVQLTLTIGAFLPDLEEGLLRRSSAYLDLFTLWGSGLVGLGASIVDRTRSASASIIIALAASLLTALVLGAVIV